MKKLYSNQILSVLEISGEMVKGKGEDAHSCSVETYRGYVGVFDGCGGIGSKRYGRTGQMTGAFLASRLAAKIFLENEIAQPGYLNHEGVHEELEMELSKRFQMLKRKIESGSGFKMKGDLQRALPTTAVVISAMCKAESISVKYLWAGDSRGYVLTDKGLGQVTLDDIDGREDAFSNISGDARLNNMLNADGGFVLNEKTLEFDEPGIFFAATDGVFNYMPTPMDFENVLLQTLRRADSILNWERRLKHIIAKYASDDYTFVGLIYGFESFEQMKAYYAPRDLELQQLYMQPMKQARTRKGHKSDIQFWESYKTAYEQYLF